ncbi:(d)CMP kinase [Acetobacter oeni]|uniref:Cytidylate kinase n=1 Tax=Acetobacter oeni TaxID=304077 RepID=A0A511XHB9_9PROT|nr:(d)CMP kinase [Acetobacter oeni]MBB3881184.1 cytidylate kinase [Acetobacter oeni]NHO18061.1 (d)CMP kinase [Acetobacter oeni]GBR08436.1 cytidylate kinase [Acetobacter oeni LMG 21952]GEN62337.1 cytidylate kinase [Acetobacter oeni]
MTKSLPVIAVDGPAAAGKGTLAKCLADALCLPYLDTGLLYRAVGRLMLDGDLDPATQSGEQIAAALRPDDLKRTDLRTPDVDRAASLVAGDQAVRQALVHTQRAFAAERGGVLDGRDIGTVIFPDADVKLYITASVRTRAERRYMQTGGSVDAPDREARISEVEAALTERDRADTSRSAAPLRMAADAVKIETDTLIAEQVLAEAIRIVKSVLDAKAF